MIELKKVWVDKSDKGLAREVHRRFSQLEGGQHIASRCAIEWLSASLRTFQPRRVLELGAGIGTLTEVILNHWTNVEQLVSTENSSYCLHVLRRNLTLGDDPRLIIVKSAGELDVLHYTADMIVGDGGFYSEEEFNTAKKGTVVFIENVRGRLRSLMSANFHRRGLEIEFRRYGGPRIPRFRMDISRRFGLPLPRPRRRVDGGCWIGIAGAIETVSSVETACSS